MGKLYDYLQKQLQSEEHKKDAEDCLKIYNKLKEVTGGVWSTQWESLVKVEFKGFLSYERVYKPTPTGYVFLKGIEDKQPERKPEGRGISVQMAIESHLLYAQDVLTVEMLLGMIDDLNNHINFAKHLLLDYPDTTVELTNEELNEIWKAVAK